MQRLLNQVLINNINPGDLTLALAGRWRPLWAGAGCGGSGRGGAVAGGLRRGRPPDGARCSRRAGLQQCRSFVEMCVVSCQPQCSTSVRKWAGGCNLGLPSSSFAVVTLPPRSTGPAMAGCRLVGCSVVSGRPLCSRAVGFRSASASAWGPFWPPGAPSLPAAAASAWRGRGRVPIAGWSLGGIGPDRGLRGEGRRGWCEEWARRG